MQYKYLARCWITPRSGFDLAKKNRIMETFRDVMTETLSQDPRIDSALKEFEKSNEGLVLEPIIVESDTEITDPEKEILPEIHKTYPDAVLLSCDKLPNFITT